MKKKSALFIRFSHFFLAVSICLSINPSSATAQAVLEKTPDYSARVKAGEEKVEARRRKFSEFRRFRFGGERISRKIRFVKRKVIR